VSYTCFDAPTCINFKWWSDCPWPFAKTCWDLDLEVQNKLQIVTLEVLLNVIAKFEHSCKEITMDVSKIMLFTIAILLDLFGCLHGRDSKIIEYFNIHDCKFFKILRSTLCFVLLLCFTCINNWSSFNSYMVWLCAYKICKLKLFPIS
jgi:hypothetical protein